MSGATSACAGAKPPAAPTTPFTISFNWNGAVFVHVSGASGTCSPAQGVFVIIESGGSGSYGFGTGFDVASNPSGKIGYAASSDGVHTTLGWSGFAVGESQTFTARFNDVDSAGHSVTKTTGVSITRDS